MTPLATWKNDLWTGGSWFRVNSRASHCGTLWGPICLHRTTEHQQQTLNFGPQTQPIVNPHVFAQAFLDSQVQIRLQQISWEWLVQSKWSQRQLVIRIVLATVCCRFGSWGLVIKLKFCSECQHNVWSWSSGEILKLKFGQHFAADVLKRWQIWILVNILKLGLVKILTWDLVEMLMFGWDFEVDA